MTAPPIAVDHDGLRLRVKIRGLLHVHILDTADLFAIHASHVANKLFTIEFKSTKGASVITEYDHRGTWEAVLRGLETAMEGPST